VYVPKFRSRRASARRSSQCKSGLEEVAEESSERQASAEPEDHRAGKRASAPVRLGTDKDDATKSPDESVALLTDEPASPTSFELEEGDTPARSVSLKGRGKLQRQDESIV